MITFRLTSHTIDFCYFYIYVFLLIFIKLIRNSEDPLPEYRRLDRMHSGNITFLFLKHA